MKKILISAYSIAALTGSVAAADLPSRKAAPAYVPPPATPMWTGFHVGLNAGGTWSNSNMGTQAYPIPGNWDNASAINDGWALAATASALPYGGNSSASGFIGGGQIGYDWQIASFSGLSIGSGLVTGVEADIQGIAGGSTTRNYFGVGNYAEPIYIPPPPTVDVTHDVTFSTFGQQSSALQYIGTVRGRAGLLVSPTLLVYGTGGLAYGGATMNSSWMTVGTFASQQMFNNGQTSAFGGTHYSNTQVGWTAGGGLEWMFLPNWSVKAEYLYYDLGRANAQGIAISSYGSNSLWGYAISQSQRFNGNIVRAGINYHFNFSSAPIVVKY